MFFHSGPSIHGLHGRMRAQNRAQIRAQWNVAMDHTEITN